MNVLDQVVAQAEAAAANIVPVQHQATDITPVTPGKRLTLADALASAKMSVDAYFEVTPDGFRVGKDMTLIDQLDVSICLEEIQPTFACRAGTTYIRSSDGVIANGGGNYQQQVANFKRTPGLKVDEYTSYEIPMVLIDPISEPKKKVEYAAGAVVGYTPAPVVSGIFTDFLKKLANRGIMEGTHEVRITHTPRQNKDGKKYGTVKFELLKDVVA